MKVNSINCQNFKGLNIKSSEKWPPHILQEFSTNGEVKKLVDLFEKNGYDVQAKFIPRLKRYRKKLLKKQPQLGDTIELYAIALSSDKQYIRTIDTDAIKYFKAKKAVKEYNELRDNVGITDSVVKIYKGIL